MEFFDALVDVGLLRAVLLGDDLDGSVFQDKVLEADPKAVFDTLGTRRRVVKIPIENSLGVHLVDILSSGPAGARERKMEFGKRDSNFIHGRYNLNMKKSPWFVYIIENEKGFLYTGITTDIERRLKQHSGSLVGGAKFFRTGAPVKVMFKKKFPDRSLASKFEAMVKKLTREEKFYLIEKKRVRK